MARTDRPDHLTDQPHLADGTLDVAAGGEVVAHAERLVVGTAVAGGRRVRLSTRVVREERQVTVVLEREELVVEHLDEAGAVVAEQPSGVGTRTAAAEPAAQLVLHAEDFEIVKRTVPVEVVRAYVDRVTTERVVTEDVAREVIEVEGDTDHRPFERDPHAQGTVGAEV